jgi:hypothetical protein
MDRCVIRSGVVCVPSCSRHIQISHMRSFQFYIPCCWYRYKPTELVNKDTTLGAAMCEINQHRLCRITLRGDNTYSLHLVNAHHV